MTKNEILDFIKNHPVCFLATVEDNKPHVRGIGIYGADENGIIIQTCKIKDIYKQLTKNPEVELCFNDLKDWIQIRVSGKVEIIEDMDMKQKVIADRTFLKPLVDAKGYDVIALYRLKGKATVWTMGANLEPKTYVEI
jgi:pyridoxamine 5'-phosphate oxidase